MPDRTREEIEREWWDAWWAADFSWEGLKAKDIDGTGTVHRDRDLQHYWNRVPGGQTLRSDSRLLELGELVAEPGNGRLWHVAHVPMHWQDKTPAKAAWSPDQLKHLSRLIEARLVEAAQTVMEDVSLPSTLFPERYISKARKRDGRAQLDGVVLEILPRHPQTTGQNHLRAQRAWLGSIEGPRAQFGPGANFDDCIFVNGDFRDAEFQGDAKFQAARFLGDADFFDVTFKASARFFKMIVIGHARFSGHFDGPAHFEHIVISGNMSFGGQFASHASFIRAAFEGRTTCSVTFSGKADFTSARFEGIAHFWGTKFGGDAEFANAVFHKPVFSSSHLTGKTEFCKTASFIGATLTHAEFNNTTFIGDANFQRAIFVGHANFESTKFYSTSRFVGAAFGASATFKQGAFCGGAIFDDATFTGEAKFNDRTFLGENHFYETQFLGKVEFSGAKFEDKGQSGTMHFDRSMFTGHALFKKVTFPASPKAFSAAFAGARFAAVADFRGSGAHWIAALDDATLADSLLLDHPDEAEALRLFDREMLSAIAFDGLAKPVSAILRSADGNGGLIEAGAAGVAHRQRRDAETAGRLLEQLEGGCRTVKVAMGKARDELMEQRYYRFQLKARRLQAGTPWLEKVSSRVYALTSDYGLSLSRPLFSLLVLLLVFAAIYWAIPTTPIPSPAATPWVAPTPAPDALSMSASRMFPFGAFESVSSNYVAAAQAGGAPTLAVRAIASLQSLIAATLVFLFGLALRRRFQV